MEKSCPLSDVKWPDDLSRQLNQTQNEMFQAKWNGALTDCKGGKVSYNAHPYLYYDMY